MIPLFNKKVMYKEHPKVGVYGFYIFNEKLVNFFASFGVYIGSKRNVEIPKIIFKSEEFKKRFLRGLFDTDGSLYFDRNNGCNKPVNKVLGIKLGAVSEKLCFQVFSLLKEFGLHPVIKKPYKGKRNKNPVHCVLIYRKGDIKWYIQNIGFKNPKHYTRWQVFQKLGYCPPRTTIKRRKEILGQQ